MNRGHFIPRPARLTVRIENVDVVVLRLENSQARTLARTIKTARETLQASDQDLADLMIAALIYEATTGGTA